MAGFEVQFRRRGRRQNLGYLMNAARKFDENRGLIYDEGAVEDITERKRAEDLLRENKAFLTTLSTLSRRRSSTRTVRECISDSTGLLRSFSARRVIKLIGKSVFDINPRELAEVYHAKDAELLQNPYANLRLAG